MAAWLDDPANILLVATSGHHGLAGVGCLRVDGHITLNYVAPGCCFRGVSKTTLAALERRASALALSLLTLESTKTAFGFYRAAGFVEAGPPATRFGFPTFPMAKRLSAFGSTPSDK